MKYLDKDFYSIEMIGDVKVVHIHGFFYCAGESIRLDHPDEIYRNVEISGCYIPLNDFIHLTEDKVNEFESSCKQNVSDLNEENCKWEMASFYSDYTGYHWSGHEKAFSELTMDTPCGDYVNYKSKKVTSASEAKDKKLICVLAYVDKDYNVTSILDVKNVNA